MKTLYEILEVSENASKEIIEKAYRVLAKKYHPDLQSEANKLEAEKRMKEINEAYSVLNDEVKRKEYDNKLALERQEAQAREQAKRQYNQNNTNNANNINSQHVYQNQGQAYYEKKRQEYSQRPMTEAEYKEAKKRQEEARKQQQKMQEEVKAQYKQKYQEAYEDYLRSLGYKVKHKWTWKNYRDLFVVILIIITICTILWFFPPTHKWIMDFYNSSSIIKTIIDVIISIIRGIWNAICSFFGGNKST